MHFALKIIDDKQIYDGRTAIIESLLSRRPDIINRRSTIGTGEAPLELVERLKVKTDLSPTNSQLINFASAKFATVPVVATAPVGAPALTEERGAAVSLAPKDHQRG
jgi:hypothetical protein